METHFAQGRPAGTALGAALWIDAQERGDGARRFRMDHAFLGPAYGDEEIEQFLRWSRLPYRRLANVADETAALLAQDKVVGWFQGRMEFGPRALGARSILASPLPATMQARLNEIKDREDFRSVAPIVLEEEEAAPAVLRAREDGGKALASADTHGRQPVAAAAALQLVLRLNPERFLHGPSPGPRSPSADDPCAAFFHGFVQEVGSHADMVHAPGRAAGDPPLAAGSGPRSRWGWPGRSLPHERMAPASRASAGSRWHVAGAETNWRTAPSICLAASGRCSTDQRSRRGHAAPAA
jgi:Carbamoyltransferase C-terminus